MDDRQTPLGRLFAVLRFVARRTFVEPVRRGRVTEDPEYPWRPGISSILVVSTALYVAVVVMAFFASRLREFGEVTTSPSLTLPSLAVLVVVPAIILGSALPYVAACHWRHPVRYAVFGGLIAAYGVVLLGALGTSAGWVLIGLCAVPMTVLAFARRRAPVARWEAPVAVLFFGTLLLLAFVSGDQEGIATLGRLLGFLSWLVMPSVFGAGAAIVEIATGAAAWTARGVWEAAHSGWRRVGLVAFAGLVVWTLAANVWALVAGGDPDLAPGRVAVTLVIVLAVGAATLAIGWVVPQGLRPGVQVDADDVSTAWPDTSRLIAYAFAAAYIIGPWVWSWASLGGLDPYRTLLLVVSLGLGAWAVRTGRRGAAVPAVILAAAASSTFLIQMAVFWRVAWFSNGAMTLVLDALALAVLALLLVRRRLTADRLLGIATALLLTRFYLLRDYFDEPFTNLFALSGASVALAVGLIWRQLTEYEYTRRGSRWFPVDARVLFGLGNMLLIGVCILAENAAGSSATTALGHVEGLADETVGTALYLAATLSSVLIAWRGREGGEQRPGEEFRIDRVTRVEPKDTVPAPRRADDHVRVEPKAGVPDPGAGRG